MLFTGNRPNPDNTNVSTKLFILFLLLIKTTNFMCHKLFNYKNRRQQSYELRLMTIKRQMIKEQIVRWVFLS